jgi:hypothetical protein
MLLKETDALNVNRIQELDASLSQALASLAAKEIEAAELDKSHEQLILQKTTELESLKEVIQTNEKTSRSIVENLEMSLADSLEKNASLTLEYVCASSSITNSVLLFRKLLCN